MTQLKKDDLLPIISIFIKKYNHMHNFGSLLDTLKEFVTDSIVDKKKYDKKVLKSVFKLLRENVVLNTQFKLYDGFTDFHSEDDFTISEYITESINTVKPFSAKQLKEANSLFKSELDKLTNNKPIVESSGLHSAIFKVLSSNKPSNKSLAKSVIREHIKTNNTRLVESSDYVPTDMLVKVLSERFNKKYSDLSESDLNLIKTVVEKNGEKKEQNFKQVVKECIEAVNTQLSENDSTVKEKLLSVKERLLEMSYNGDSYEVDMVRIIGLKNSLM
jgi:hypothetical protein